MRDYGQPGESLYMATGRALSAWARIEDALREIFCVCASDGVEPIWLRTVHTRVARAVLEAFDFKSKLMALEAALLAACQESSDQQRLTKRWSAEQDKLGVLWSKHRTLTASEVMLEHDADGNVLDASLRVQHHSCTTEVRIGEVERWERQFLAGSRRLIAFASEVRHAKASLRTVAAD